MNNVESVGQLLKPYGPRLALHELVAEVNQLYHALEAKRYDLTHREIHEQLPPLWGSMVRHVEEALPRSGYRVLDFGCGTGFEAQQLLCHLSPDRIGHLTCYDPCPEMLARCRERIAPLLPSAVFCSHRDDIAPSSSDEAYNLLTTNSLLHHLPDPAATITGLSPLLAPDALWLAGHEPSRRFYLNAECMTTYGSFRRERQWKRFLSPKQCLAKLEQSLGLADVPARKTAREAFLRGFFEREPTARAIASLVDFHVPLSPAEAHWGRGFDLQELEQAFGSSWKLSWVRTYSFMGPYYEGSIPIRWARRCHGLAQRFPDDGANLCAVWRRP